MRVNIPEKGMSALVNQRRELTHWFIDLFIGGENCQMFQTCDTVPLSF